MNPIALILTLAMSQIMGADKVIVLPEPAIEGGVSLSETLAKRRSVRAFSPQALSIEQIGQLLWAAQGITDKGMGLRAAPSAGALYPLELYLVIEQGVYHYDPRGHRLQRILVGEKRKDLQKAALGQEVITAAPAVFVITALYRRTAVKYGQRAARYAHLEAGHACQNLLLQATALGLAGVPVGAFNDGGVIDELTLENNHRPLYLVPVGYQAE